MELKCFSCAESFLLENFLRHLKIWVKSKEGDQDFVVYCGHITCQKKFLTFSGLYQHLEVHKVKTSNKRPGDVIEEESESAGEIFETFETQLNELIIMMCVASVPDTQQTDIIRHLKNHIENCQPVHYSTDPNTSKHNSKLVLPSNVQ